MFLAGLALAAAVMLIIEMFMVMLLRRPELLLLAAPLTVLFVLTAGVAAGAVAARVSRGMPQRKAALVFFATGSVAGALWGYPLFTVLIRATAATTGADAGASPTTALAGLGAAYLASTAGVGALAGRYFGPFAATRPRLVAYAVGAVAIVTTISLVVLFSVRFS